MYHPDVLSIRPMRATHARTVVWLAIVLACGSRASALNPALDVSQYGHTAWTVREGFFSSGVLSIAQTRDGYLWVGTESGLFRFDGVRTIGWQFSGREQLPHEFIAKLLATRDGRLWIGTFAGLASWKDGRLVTYPEFVGQVVDALIEDAQGTVWAGTMESQTDACVRSARQLTAAGKTVVSARACSPCSRTAELFGSEP
jgi:ligand-binding sensor domain-containing protein